MKVEPSSIWQNYRPLKKPEPAKLDPNVAGPYMEQLAMAFIGLVVLSMLFGDLVRFITGQLL